MEQINVITIQDAEGLVTPEPEPKQETVVSKGKGEVDHNDQKSTQKPRTPDKSKPSQDKLNTSPNQLNVGDKVLLDAADPPIATPEPNEEIPLTVLNIFPYGTVDVIHPKFGTFKLLTSNILTESWNTGFLKTTRPGTRVCIKLCENKEIFFPNTESDKSPRLCDMALGEPVKLARACDKLVPSTRSRHCQNKHGRGPIYKGVREANEVRHNVRHDRVHQHAQRTRAWAEGTMSSLRGKKTVVLALKKRKGAASLLGPTTEIRHMFLQILRARPLGVGRFIKWAALEQIQLADAIRALLTTDPWGFFFEIVDPTYLEFTLELCLTFYLQTIMTNFDDPGTVQFRLGGLVRQLSVPEFEIALGLDLVPASATYDPSHSKALALPPSLRYLHAILAHTLTGRRESTGVVTTHDAYFLWSMVKGTLSTSLTLLPSPFATRRSSIGEGAAQSSPLALISQMSPQGISSMLTIKSSKAHYRIGPKNSTGKGSLRLPCPARPRP
ncbi:hypothetical protein GOBAR_AA23574 [Gossypium barbadense]|uniref:Uncharacterized protein n=1 Tax=Gossypium barbadense TaxID=3634 RepID=A0A2P5X196_GOSBA|nr:hypothetical protein GOBAR_AA23574 [Gossypium barbadense]